MTIFLLIISFIFQYGSYQVSLFRLNIILKDNKQQRFCFDANLAMKISWNKGDIVVKWLKMDCHNLEEVICHWLWMHHSKLLLIGIYQKVRDNIDKT